MSSDVSAADDRPDGDAGDWWKYVICATAGILIVAVFVLLFKYYERERKREEDNRKKFEDEVEMKQKEEDIIQAHTIARKNELSNLKIEIHSPREIRNLVFKKAAMQMSVVPSDISNLSPLSKWDISKESPPQLYRSAFTLQ